MKKAVTATALTCLVLFLQSCAPSGYEESQAGFFSGLIHGFVLFPFALLAKLFGMDYGLYAEHNSGVFYWLGYIIGIGGLGGGAASGR